MVELIREEWGVNAPQHEWTGPRGPIKWEHCRLCLIIKRPDGRNSPCKGSAPVLPRMTQQPRKTPHAPDHPHDP